MRFGRAIIVARRDWADLRANKLLLLSLAALPALFTLMPVIIAWITVQEAAQLPESKAADLARALKDVPEGFTPAQLSIVLVLRSWIGLFLMLPVFVPIVLAAQAVVGEKERRTIEPLLAAPLTRAELFLGKAMSALVPGILISWVAFAIFASLMNWVAWPHFGRAVLPDPVWSLAVFVVSPLLALFGNGLAVLVSSRVNDARLAQQIAGTAVIPLVAIIVVQLARGTAFQPQFYLVAALVLAAVDLVVYRVAIALFDRERILTSLR